MQRDREFVAIVGPSGWRQDDRLANGPPGWSSRRRDGEASKARAPATQPGPKIARQVVFQQFALFPWKSVLRQHRLRLEQRQSACRRRRAASASQRQRQNSMGLQGQLKSAATRINCLGGMQQRVAIARSYVLDPDRAADGRAVRRVSTRRPAR